MTDDKTEVLEFKDSDGDEVIFEVYKQCMCVGTDDGDTHLNKKQVQELIDYLQRNIGKL